LHTPAGFIPPKRGHTLATGPSNPRQETPHWKVLASQASQEQDSIRLSSLVDEMLKELDNLVDERQTKAYQAKRFPQ